MLRTLSLIGATVSSILATLSLLAAFYTLEPVAFMVAVIFGALLMLSSYGLRQTRPIGKILPSAEPAKLRLFKELRKIKSVHLRAPLALSFALIFIHVALLISGKLSLLPTNEELHNVGVAFGRSSAHSEAWRLFTGLFLHHSIGQLLCNVLGILTMGRLLDYLIGWKSFLTVYILGGLGASIVSSIAYPDTAIAGPTGAIFAVYGTVLVSLLLSRKMRKIDVPNSVIFGASIQAISSVGPGYALHVGGLTLGFAVGLLWFLLENDLLLRRYALATTGFVLVLFSVTFLPRFTPGQTAIALDRSPASIAPTATALGSMETKLWNNFEVAQEYLKNSSWLKKAVVPMVEGSIEQAENFQVKVLRPLFVKTKKVPPIGIKVAKK